MVEFLVQGVGMDKTMETTPICKGHRDTKGPC